MAEKSEPAVACRAFDGVSTHRRVAAANFLQEYPFPDVSLLFHRLHQPPELGTTSANQVGTLPNKKFK